MSAGAQYSVGYESTARKELGKLDRQAARRIARAVWRARRQPAARGMSAVVGYDDLWRIRIGDYRVIYAIRDDELTLLALRIAHRGEVYQRI